MTIAFVQSGNGSTSLSAANGNVNCTWTGATTTGNFLVVTLSALTATGLDTFTITPPSGWAIAGSQFTAAASSVGTDMVAIYYKANVSSQASTGNFNIAVTTGVLISITAVGGEYSGMGASPTVDKTPGGTTGNPAGGPSQQNTLFTGALSASAELAIAGFLYEDVSDTLTGTTWSTVAGSNLRAQKQDSNPFSSLALVDKITAATTSIQLSAIATNSNESISDTVLALVVTFVPTAGGSTFTVTAANLGTHKVGAKTTTVTRLANAFRSLSTNAGIQQGSVSRLENAFRSLSTNVGAKTATVNRVANAFRSLSTKVGVRDTVLRQAVLLRSLLDNAGLKTTVSAGDVHNPVLTNSVGISDDILRKATVSRSSRDTSGCRDAASAGVAASSGGGFITMLGVGH